MDSPLPVLPDFMFFVNYEILIFHYFVWLRDRFIPLSLLSDCTLDLSCACNPLCLMQSVESEPTVRMSNDVRPEDRLDIKNAGEIYSI